MESMPTKNQFRTFERYFVRNGKPEFIRATVRYDDKCGNGHNTFSIAGEVYTKDRCPGEETVPGPDGKGKLWMSSCGQVVGDIEKYLPELKPYLRWHLTSSSGPMHYIENARYWAGHSGWCDGTPGSPPNAEHLRSTTVFGAVPEWDDGREPEKMSDGELVSWLGHRLPDLMEAFRLDVEALGFTY